MDFIPDHLLSYCETHSTPEPELLQKLSRETHAKVLNPRMLSGHLQGRLLSMISKIIQPNKVLEIGTYTGYSCLCLCEGLPENGSIITIDRNDELEEFAKSFFEKSAYSDRITMIPGDALEIIPHLDGPFDLVFIDADKSEYADYFEAIIEKVRKGGIILADNVLWSGHVLNEENRNDSETKGIMAFNEMIMKDQRVEALMLPLRDGITVMLKK